MKTESLKDVFGSHKSLVWGHFLTIFQVWAGGQNWVGKAIVGPICAKVFYFGSQGLFLTASRLGEGLRGLGVPVERSFGPSSPG